MLAPVAVASGDGVDEAVSFCVGFKEYCRCTVAETPGGGATLTLEIPIGTRASLPMPVRAGDVVLQREASG